MKRVIYLLTTLVILTVSCKKEIHDPNPPPPPPPPSSGEIETAPPELRPVTEQNGPINGGYYIGLPARYDQTTKKYPAILFCHGGGQIGNGASELPKVLSEGIGKMLNEKTFPADFLSGGQHFSFIVLLPQFYMSYSIDDLKKFLDAVAPKYRIDMSRVYVAGFSWGGRAATDFVSSYPDVSPAAVSMGGASVHDIPARVQTVASHHIAIWSFHNLPDEMINVSETTNFINALKALHPAVEPRMTLFPTSTAFLKHDCWTKATDATYKENGMNIYEWMLQYKK